MRYSIFILWLFLISGCKKETPKEPVSNYNLKAQWIKDSFQTIINRDFPRIKAIAWWQEKWENADGTISDLRINSSPDALNAFREGVENRLFISGLQFDNQKLIPETGHIYFGAFPDFDGPEDNVTAQRIHDFESLAGKPIAWAYFSDNWYQQISFPGAAVQTIHQSGRVPFIRMMARTELEEGVADPNYSMQNIIDGQFDNDLLQWFTEAAQVGYPLLVEFGTEVNGEWFPWNGVHNGGGTTTAYGDPNKPDGPERFVDAYRHIIDLSRQAGADNITWFFHLDAGGQPEDAWNDFENYYPGDDYIDWIGVSVYGAVTPDESVEAFSNKINRVYNRVCIMTTKPLAVLEFSVVEDIKP